MMTSTIPAAVLTIAALTSQPRGEVLDFTATWCGPCQQMAPIVHRLEQAGYPIRTVDVDRNRALAQKYRITSIPAFVLVVDGKEVTRLVGGVSQQQLLDLFSQIPSDPPVTTVSDDASARNRLEDSVPEWARSSHPPSPRSQPQSTPSRPADRDRTQPVAHVADEANRDRSTPSARGDETEESPGLFDKLFGRGRQDAAAQTPEVIRANIESETAAPENVLPVRDPGEASVRMHVTINGQTHKGSGTAIDSRTGQTLILTCGHLFEGWNERSKIEVDLFSGEEIQRFVGRMIHFDPVADVGVIAIPTDRIIATAAVAPASSRPQVGEPLVSIGCSGGAAPTQEQIQVTDLNFYEGPDNILCTGIPVQGRSGGGLFNREGQLVGVCIAADADRQRGAYAGLLAVHDLLSAAGLADLCQPASPTQPPAEFAAQAAPIASGIGSPAPTSLPPTTSATRSPAAPAAQPAPAAQVVNTQPPASAATAPSTKPDFDPFASPSGEPAGDMEVICIIRSRRQPETPSRVVIIDRPSPRFLSYLDGEVAARETPVRANHVPSANPVHSSSRVPPTTTPAPVPSATRYPASSTRFSNPNGTGASSETLTPREHSRSASLEPTALTQPFQPRRYVRSADTRDAR